MDKRKLVQQLRLTRQRISRLEEELSREKQRMQELEGLLAAAERREGHTRSDRSVTLYSPPEDKIALFRSLFYGRQDVFARRWENPLMGISGYQPVCANEWAPGICSKGKGTRVRCSECSHAAFIPISDTVLEQHLSGCDALGKDFVIGVYPLLPDETCRFLALDFDQDTWELDSLAVIDACAAIDVPATRERSRSGKGAHVWIFFSEEVPAKLARQLGEAILRRAMQHRPELGLNSFDRMFPNQDHMPKGGFGNLIALPLQKKAREYGNSVFVDETGKPYPDQWEHLSGLRRLTLHELHSLLESVQSQSGGRGLVNDHYAAEASAIISSDLPEHVSIILNNGIEIPRNLPATLRHEIIQLAAFHNPEFYRRDHLRLSTRNTPRFIICAEERDDSIFLPRGCLEDLINLLKRYNVAFSIADQRCSGEPVFTRFLGQLDSEQEVAAAAMLAHDTGTLAAPTAFGKTVVALSVLAHRHTNTLILVNRRVLVEQWKNKILAFLDIQPGQIGVIGGGKSRPSGKIDIATIQSFYREHAVDPLVRQYGHLIVDECHHLPARTFEKVTQEFAGKYVLGLSATVNRKDGHQPIVFMQCGPIRYRVDARKQAAKRGFHHQVIVRDTGFTLKACDSTEQIPIHSLYRTLSEDEARNQMILADIVDAVKAGRSPLVISERREHVETLAESLSRSVKNVIVFHGRMGVKQRRTAQERLAAIPHDEERVIVATGRYLGEGFDDARLDTLFLTLPIAWKGLLQQYAGRLHRAHAAKSEVRIYDYVDGNIPLLQRMFAKREAGYGAMGYSIHPGLPWDEHSKML